MSSSPDRNAEAGNGDAVDAVDAAGRRDPTCPAARGDAGRVCEARWLGRRDYADTMARMDERARRRRDLDVPDALWLVEHPHVITVGRRGTFTHLVASNAQLEERGVSLHPTGRGGDITYHGPGQLVGYPIVGLRDLGIGPRCYVNRLEEILIRTVAGFGVTAGRIEGRTGVWVGNAKIAAIGVQIGRGVTSHGFALNVATDLSYFDLIVPCGIAGASVTSLSRELGRAVTLDEVMAPVADTFGRVFERRITWLDR